ncbi:MAG TPA: methyltransferase domain-containing protein [Gemmatimonadales bacterium]|nr:methyltransferase domain-containing protein [Gemmatimonadales bacterium]
MRPFLRATRRTLRNVVHWPGHRRRCPVCGSFVRAFKPYGLVLRPEARCPSCGALERHRLVWLYLRYCTPFFDRTPRLMLHVAPERALEPGLTEVPNLRRITGDLTQRGVMLRFDVTGIPLPDDCFDVIYCSHVLEHVPDDHAAMRELHRVLKPGGFALLQVPVLREQTFEDPSVTSPEERLRLFGQHDHVRVYGRDYPERLAQAGFIVRVEDFAALLPPPMRTYYGLMPGELVYRGEKAGRPAGRP